VTLLDGVAFEDAPELTPYQDEPAQMPSAAPGKVGRARLAFELRGDRTVLADMFRQAPLVVQKALHWDTAMPEMACVILISSAGGMLQGDRQFIDVTLGSGTRAYITTQSANKIHTMDANYAAQSQRLVLAEAAYLEFLPEPVIPFRKSRFITRTTVELPRSATMVYAEILLAGRAHYQGGEIFQYDLFSSTLTVSRPDRGPQLFVEKLLIEPGRFAVDRCGVLAGFNVLGNVLLLTPPESADRVGEAMPPIWDRDRSLAAAVCRLPNDAGLSYRVLGRETEPVRAEVLRFCAVARAQAVGRPSPPTFRWR
jgi:urease accessory protein